MIFMLFFFFFYHRTYILNLTFIFNIWLLILVFLDDLDLLAVLNTLVCGHIHIIRLNRFDVILGIFKNVSFLERLLFIQIYFHEILVLLLLGVALNNFILFLFLVSLNYGKIWRITEGMTSGILPLDLVIISIINPLV